MTMATETETQTCTNCEREKALDEYPENSMRAGRLRTCKACMAEKRKGNGGHPGPTTYINPGAKEKTTRAERHRIAGAPPLTEEEVQAVEQATRNMLSEDETGKWEQGPEPMAPIDELLEDGKIDEPRRWYLCDRALQGWRKGLEKRKAG